MTPNWFWFSEFDMEWYHFTDNKLLVNKHIFDSKKNNINPEEILIDSKNDLITHLREESEKKEIEQEKKIFWEKITSLY